MKYFNWNQEKNEKLKADRGISFENIILKIEDGDIVDILEHPNKKKYKNQKMFLINIEEYIYLVPFIENKEEIFLKTIIPSRKFTKEYLKGDKQ